MQELVFDNNLLAILLILVVGVLVVQAYMMLRIRQILQVLSIHADSLMYYFRKLLSREALPYNAASQMPKTCQFCKHRLAYINTTKTSHDANDFYHRCGLRNVNITLSDSCEQFQTDKEMAD